MLMNVSHSYEGVTLVLERVLPKSYLQLDKDLTTYMDKDSKAGIRIKDNQTLQRKNDDVYLYL